jgi:hypothetical protein
LSSLSVHTKVIFLLVSDAKITEKRKVSEDFLPRTSCYFLLPFAAGLMKFDLINYQGMQILIYQNTTRSSVLLSARYLLAICLFLALCSTLQNEVSIFFRNVNERTVRYVVTPENSSFHKHSSENLKSNI